MFGIVNNTQQARGGALPVDTYKLKPPDYQSPFILLPEGSEKRLWFKR